MAEVVFEAVTKRFGEAVAIDRLDLGVEDKELLVLLGPSGCGKTTALRMVAGLEEPEEGAIHIGDKVVNHTEPKDRDVAMVFQSYALYPHMTVAKNIEFPLQRRKVPKEDRSRQVADAAEHLGLQDLLHRKPGQLSGGQRQRVALARAIVRHPQVFLMDEPLSNLDAALRLRTRADIVELQRRLGVTTLYVTHDQVEAMTMGHRIALLNHGRLQQIGAPQDLYAEPANTFVASFLGSPGMNLVPGRLDTSGGLVVSVSSGEVPIGGLIADQTQLKAADVVLGARPEDIQLDGDGQIKAEVVLVEMLGAEFQVICRLEDQTQLVVRQSSRRVVPRSGELVRLAMHAQRVHLFTADTGQRIPIVWSGR